jgi:hypothetical protein
MIAALQTNEIAAQATDKPSHSRSRAGSELPRIADASDRLSKPQPLTRANRPANPTTLDMIQQVERLISSVARLIDSVVYLIRLNDYLKE